MSTKWLFLMLLPIINNALNCSAPPSIPEQINITKLSGLLINQTITVQYVIAEIKRHEGHVKSAQEILNSTGGSDTMSQMVVDHEQGNVNLTIKRKQLETEILQSWVGIIGYMTTVYSGGPELTYSDFVFISASILKGTSLCDKIIRSQNLIRSLLAKGISNMKQMSNSNMDPEFTDHLQEEIPIWQQSLDEIAERQKQVKTIRNVFHTFSRTLFSLRSCF